MKIIALEEHFLTPEVRAAWAHAAAAGRDAGEPLNLGTMQEMLEELGEQRIAHMDESGVQLQVLSLTSPGMHNLQQEEAVSFAGRTNDLIAATVARFPARFDGFATIPTPAPLEAARELERAVLELGLKGGMLFGRVVDKHLDHPDFLPIFEAASRLQVPLFLHPQVPPRAVQEAYYTGFAPEVSRAFSAFGIGWHYDCGVEFLRLALAGVFDRFPDLQLILGHWGEVVLFYEERLKGLSRFTRLRRTVTETMRQNLYVTSSGMFSESNFRHAEEVVGIDRILFSTDYPYQYRPGGGPKAFLDELPLSQGNKEKIAFGNWERLTSGIRR